MGKGKGKGGGSGTVQVCMCWTFSFCPYSKLYAVYVHNCTIRYFALVVAFFFGSSYGIMTWCVVKLIVVSHHH